MAENKRTGQRIAIVAIAVIMTVGTLGSFLIVIMQNNEQQSAASQAATTEKKTLPVDKTAYKVEDKVKELQKIDVTPGTGEAAKVGDTVRLQYKGTLAQTGGKFDSSYDRGEPAQFTLDDQMIKGFVQGVEGMKVGGKRRIVIPSELGYGATDMAAAGIPANSDLVFEVELLAVNPPKTDTEQ